MRHWKCNTKDCIIRGILTITHFRELRPGDRDRRLLIEVITLGCAVTMNFSSFKGLGLGQDLSQWLHGRPQLWHEWGAQESRPGQRMVQTFDTGQELWWFYRQIWLNILFEGGGRVLQCPSIGRGRGYLWRPQDAQSPARLSQAQVRPLTITLGCHNVKCPILGKVVKIELDQSNVTVRLVWRSSIFWWF